MSAASFAVAYGLDLFAVLACAYGGAIQGVRNDLGLFGTLVLSECAALGGGLVRDLVLGAEPVAFNHPGYFLPPVLTAVSVFFFYNPPLGVRSVTDRWLEVCDAAGVAIFSVTGAVKALDYGAGLVTAAALGTVSGIGGGILCGALTAQVAPVMSWRHYSYVTPCVVGASLAAGLQLAGSAPVYAMGAGVLSAFTWRALALMGHWRSARSRYWKSLPSGSSRLGVDMEDPGMMWEPGLAIQKLGQPRDPHCTHRATGTFDPARWSRRS